MSFKEKNVLITGGMGFIGSNLAIELVRLGARVTILDSMLENYGGNLFNVEPVKNDIKINFSDLRDANSLKYIIKNMDYIFDLAGQISHQDSMTDPFTDLNINVFAQLNLLESCRLYNPEVVIVYTSTRQLYGKPLYLPVDENHPTSPSDVNGINKLAAEQYHSLYAKVYDLKTVSLRLTNTYGPRSLIRNSRQGVIGWFINRAILGKTIQLYDAGEQIRDFTYVSDVVEAILATAVNRKCYGQVYNLSGFKSTLKEISKIIISICGKGSVENVGFPEERKKIDIGDYYSSSAKLLTDTDWKPTTSIYDGMKKTLEYYEENKRYYCDLDI